jgi:hypothetical protein
MPKYALYQTVSVGLLFISVQSLLVAIESRAPLYDVKAHPPPFPLPPPPTAVSLNLSYCKNWDLIRTTPQ